MHNKKKASAKAGQKLKHDHYQLAASCVQANRSVDPSPYEKPSRRNRRQKRTWRRKPGNGLTRSTGLAQNEGSLKVKGRNQTASSLQPSGFSFCPQRMLMDCSRQQSVDHQRGLRVAVTPRPHPLTRRDNPRQFSGGSLNLEVKGGHMAITIKTRNAGTSERTPRLFPLSLRPAAHRGLRHITGPALAFRGAFRVGGAK